MTGARPDGQPISVTSFSRPLKVAIVISDPASSRSFRAAVQALCSVWGGGRSVIVSGTRAAAISSDWAPAVSALDPDAVFLSERLYRRDTRARLEAFLDRRMDVPFVVAKLNPRLTLSPYIRAASLNSVMQPTMSASASATRRSSPVEVAVRGLLPDVPAVGPRRIHTTSTAMRNSPAALAIAGVPGYRAIAQPGRGLFLFHEANDVRSAMWLWNLRGVYGDLRHGTAAVTLAEATARPFALSRVGVCVYLDPIPTRVRRKLAELGVTNFIAANDFPWGRSQAGRLIFDQERDDIVAVNDQFSIPRRTPVVRSLGAGARQTEATGIDGAYAVELAIQTNELPGRRHSIPARHASLDSLVRPPGSTLQAGPTSTHSRPTRTGDGVLLVRPGRFARAVRLTLPSLDASIAGLAPELRWELSDKGHFTRWFVRHAGGLFETHELLTDARGSLILDSFRSHHVAGKRIVKSYRRFMTVADMRDVFAAKRAAGELARRMAETDGVFLERWIDRLVSADILRLGVLTKCSECLDTSFLAIGSFGRTYSCPRCGESRPTPTLPLVGYSLAEAAHQFLINDGDVNVFAVTALARRARGGFAFDFDHNVIEATSKREIDFVAVLDGRVVIGESKKSGDIDRSDCDLLKRLAGKVRAWAVVVATGTNCAPCGPACVNDFRSEQRSRDASLPGGAGGPRDQVIDLRTRLAPETLTLVLCGSDLRAPAVASL